MNVSPFSGLINLTYAPGSACPDALLTTPCTLPAKSAARTGWTLTNSTPAAIAARIRLPWLNIVGLLLWPGIDSSAFQLLRLYTHLRACNRTLQQRFLSETRDWRQTAFLSRRASQRGRTAARRAG